jgi:hypothetical protein
LLTALVGTEHLAEVIRRLDAENRRHEREHCILLRGRLRRAGR